LSVGGEGRRSDREHPQREDQSGVCHVILL
jgi:hypothetical protein